MIFFRITVISFHTISVLLNHSLEKSNIKCMKIFNKILIEHVIIDLLNIKELIILYLNQYI